MWIDVRIARGLPGSGKSTWADKFLKSCTTGLKSCVSADAYHMVNGIYRFDPARAGEVHRSCLRAFLAVLQDACVRAGHVSHEPVLTIPADPAAAVIVVDNTNTTPWEIAPYMALAQAHGCYAEVVYFPCTLEAAITNNIHQVPDAKLMQMQHNLQTQALPAHWPLRVVRS